MKKTLGLAYMPHPENDKLHIISQSKINNLISDLTFTKQNELLACRLPQRNLLNGDTQILSFRKYFEEQQESFTFESNLIFIFNALEVTYEQKE